jgi:hypothetical protein
MAQMAELDSDWPAAVIRYWNVIRRRIHSGACDEDDEDYVSKFRALYQVRLVCSPHGFSKLIKHTVLHH